MRRPLRSVMLGSPRYLSAYALGVAQAMGQLGHWHRSVSIFEELGEIERQIAEMAPDVIWTHMALWPPAGAPPVADLLQILGRWKRRGTAVFLHDGDPRARTVDADLDVEAAFTLALVNRALPAHWPIPAIHWPYAAFAQAEIGEPLDEWRCDLLFAGHLRRAEEGYGDRTRLVHALRARLGRRMRIVSPGGGDTNNRMLFADVAPSAGAVLGYGRPDVPGWIDTRVFQVGGAGGVLIHDDAGGILEPGVHFVPFDPRRGVDAVLAAMECAREEGPRIRAAAFAHIQAHHTWRHRVEAALAVHFGGAA
jgi:hypothetical protein